MDYYCSDDGCLCELQPDFESETHILKLKYSSYMLIAKTQILVKLCQKFTIVDVGLPSNSNLTTFEGTR